MMEKYCCCPLPISYFMVQEVLWQSVQVTLQRRPQRFLLLIICRSCSSPKKLEVYIPSSWICTGSKTNLTNKIQRKKYYEYSKSGLRRPGSFYILKSSHHVMRKSKQPCEETHVENNQDPWLTGSAELPAKSQHQCDRYEWAILDVYPPAEVKTLQLVAHGTKISCFHHILSKLQNHCCFRSLSSEVAYYTAIEEWNTELSKVT